MMEETITQSRCISDHQLLCSWCVVQVGIGSAKGDPVVKVSRGALIGYSKGVLNGVLLLIQMLDYRHRCLNVLIVIDCFPDAYGSVV